MPPRSHLGRGGSGTGWPHLVWIRRCEAVALQEERGLGEQLIQEYPGVTLGDRGEVGRSQVASYTTPPPHRA